MAWFVPRQIPLPAGFIGFDPQSSVPDTQFTAYGRHLPHWRREGACYLATFRLRDSLPEEIVARMRDEQRQWQARLASAASKNEGRIPQQEWSEWQAFEQRRARKLDLLLDEGRGECLLRHAAHRTPLVEALHHQEGTRVEMLAYAIMPNHAHVLCRPLPGHALEALLGSWKRRSSQRIHRLLGRSGPMWQDESWDRIIRDGDHYATAARYIAKNPLAAGLSEDEATVWLHPTMQGA
ncbi:MAG: transposase [Verrucomicrobiaceae bacterium]|jgi:putative transposase|nr:transposase [Verrucomicrobiaceae bacterium]